MMRGAWVAGCGLLALTAPAAGQPPAPDAMVEVRRAGEAGSGVRLLGFVADGAGHVVAQIVVGSAGRVAGADFVVRLAGGAEYAAQGVAHDAASGLGLLRVTADPPLTPYPFARDPAERGRTIYGAVLSDDAGAVAHERGSVIDVAAAPDATEPATIRHNALAGERKHGAPLFNNCGQVVGVIVERADAPPGAGLAVSAEWLVTVFGPDGLAPLRVDDVCLSEAEQARQEAEQARQEAERARQEAEQARQEAAEQTRQAEARQAEVEQARQEAEQARQAETERARQAEARQAEAERERLAAEQARRAAEEERAAAERERAAAAEQARQAEARQAATEQAAEDATDEEQAAAERARQAARRTVAWAVAAGGGASALLLGLWLAARRSRARVARAARTAEAEASAARAAMAARAAAERETAAVPDVVLTGTDPAGRPVSLRVPGRAVADPSGAVVGRSPFDGEVVLNLPDVSRRHFRLFRADGTLMVEDLGSMNGTVLDGAALAAGAAAPLAAGARLRVGEIEFTVRSPAGGGEEGGE